MCVYVCVPNFMPSEIRAVFVSLTVLSAMGTSEKKVHIWDGDHDDEDGDLLW